MLITEKEENYSRSYQTTRSLLSDDQAMVERLDEIYESQVTMQDVMYEILLVI